MEDICKGLLEAGMDPETPAGCFTTGNYRGAEKSSGYGGYIKTGLRCGGDPDTGNYCGRTGLVRWQILLAGMKNCRLAGYKVLVNPSERTGFRHGKETAGTGSRGAGTSGDRCETGGRQNKSFPGI